MKPVERHPHAMSAGFTLPVVMVISSALLLLAIGLLLLVGVERKTARSYVDREKAELAAKSGLQDVISLMRAETANDEYLVVQSSRQTPIETGKTPAPHLFLARGKSANGGLDYRYVPLFSSSASPQNTQRISAPKVEDLVSNAQGTTVETTTLPYLDKVQLNWVNVTDGQGRLTGRYAYWVEDLQSRVDARTAGNQLDASASHRRYGWKSGEGASISGTARFPAPGLNPLPSDIGSDGRDRQPPLNPIALYLLDPNSTSKDTSSLDKTIIDQRAALISPDSTLAVAGIVPPLTRDTTDHLTNPIAKAIEENLVANVQPYDEQALVPYAKGLDASVLGKPKLNLNALLAKPADTAVEEMAAWINRGLPEFVNRKGGFPDDYLKTLAANAYDYADTDKEATVRVGSYRGLDAYPLMSEVILHIKYLGVSTQSGRSKLLFQKIVFVELWNHTNLPVQGNARVSYENSFLTPAIGAGISSGRFDDPVLINDKTQCLHALSNINGRFWSAPIAVDLQPNEYRFYKATTVNYILDAGSSSQSLQSKFEIVEDAGFSGISMMWNDREVDRSDKLARGNGNPTDPELEYTTKTAKQSGKANIPGHSYGYYNTVNNYKNNMGDSRQALYLRGSAYPLSDNSYPQNVSPNRRNIRYNTIYKKEGDNSSHPLVYGRVLPSEWPDGGHDSEVSKWTVVTGFEDKTPGNDNDNININSKYDPSDITQYPVVRNSKEGDAPTYLSNRGRFYSATELGRIFDPIMYRPTFDNDADSNSIRTGTLPGGRVSWPSVETGSVADIYYGGGNTLRIGRPEHPMFDQPKGHVPSEMSGRHAARLLDLFHAGKSRSENLSERQGDLVRIEGHLNINTASFDSLRAMAGGILQMDPKLVKRTSENHSTTTMAAPVSALEVSAPTKTSVKPVEADLLAEAIIRGRPYASPSELATVMNSSGVQVFGNRDLLPDGNKVQWSDAAAEEVFARVYESSTVRSRNFRVWVIGQSLSPTSTGSANPEVLAEVRKAYTVFANPGERDSSGSIQSNSFRVSILNENDF